MNLKVTKEVLSKLRFEKSRHPRLKSFHKKVSSVVNCQSYRVKTLTLLITSNKFEVTNRKFQDKKVVSDVEITVHIAEKDGCKYQEIINGHLIDHCMVHLWPLVEFFVCIGNIFQSSEQKLSKDWRSCKKV